MRTSLTCLGPPVVLENPGVPSQSQKLTIGGFLEDYLGLPVVPFLTNFFGWEGSPTKIDYREKNMVPYSKLSTGGPRNAFPGVSHVQVSALGARRVELIEDVPSERVGFMSSPPPKPTLQPEAAWAAETERRFRTGRKVAKGAVLHLFLFIF